jgi:hypothetical protein
MDKMDEKTFGQLFQVQCFKKKGSNFLGKMGLVAYSPKDKVVFS